MDALKEEPCSDAGSDSESSPGLLECGMEEYIMPDANTEQQVSVEMVKGEPCPYLDNDSESSLGHCDTKKEKIFLQEFVPVMKSELQEPEITISEVDSKANTCEILSQMSCTTERKSGTVIKHSGDDVSKQDVQERQHSDTPASSSSAHPHTNRETYSRVTMDNNKNKGPKKKELFKYSEKDLEDALQDIGDKKGSIRKIARKYSIPHSTLLNKLKGNVPLKRKMGPSTCLTEAEENLLVSWILTCAKKGLPVKRRTLCETVRDFITQDLELNASRKVPFRNNKPGRRWFDSFMKRHPTLSEIYAEGVGAAQAAVTEHELRKWFTELQNYLKEENAPDVLQDASRIFIADVSAFQTCPKTGKVLGPISFKNLHEINKSGNEKEAVTVMSSFNASGSVAPPMIVFPLEGISEEMAPTLSETWGIGRSRNGWITSALYYEYIANLFLPWVTKQQIEFPVLLVVDGHKSHVTYNVCQLCSENGILQFAMLPNSADILQPADVSILRPLKHGWSKTVNDWKQTSGNEVVSKTTFGDFFETFITEKVTPEVIQNGFRKCGLFPFSPESVDYSKCLTSNSESVDCSKNMSSTTRQCPPVVTGSEAVVKPASFETEHLLYFESVMKPGRAEEFQRSENSGWQGDPEAKELFDVWKVIRSSCVPGRKKSDLNHLLQSLQASTSQMSVGDPSALVLQGDTFKLDSTAPLQNQRLSPSTTKNKAAAPVQVLYSSGVFNKGSVGPAVSNHMQSGESPAKKSRKT